MYLNYIIFLTLVPGNLHFEFAVGTRSKLHSFWGRCTPTLVVGVSFGRMTHLTVANNNKKHAYIKSSRVHFSPPSTNR